VRDVQFTCRSDRGGARIFLSAEVGRFRDEWMRSPDWSGYWQGVFGGGDRRGRDADYWVTLGHERFEGRNDRENHFAGWGGQSVDRIGLRALNDDATCWPMRVEFANGSSTSIGVGHLEQGRPKSFDLPGQERNVRNIVLNCHADHGHAVTIDILARK
ncbi:MAG: hypothetical protein JO261_06630, partial [Alphaproteobacteria bacterium]|nr:hypothetical protein [Alphaproteobacteria bacterium]